MSIIKAIKNKNVVSTRNAKIGLLVERGPDWCFDKQDYDNNGNQTAGIIINYTPLSQYLDDKWVDVRWNGNNKKYCYRIGPINFDLKILHKK